MAGVNKVIILGNLGADPEVRALPSGMKVANINIATSESYTGKDGQRVEQTEWHRVTAWGKTADIIEKYVTKGKEIELYYSFINNVTYFWQNLMKHGIGNFYRFIIISHMMFQ